MKWISIYLGAVFMFQVIYYRFDPSQDFVWDTIGAFASGGNVLWFKNKKHEEKV